MAKLYYTRTCSGGNDIYNFVRTFLAFYHYVLTLSARCSGVKKKSFNEKHNFTVFIPNLRLRVTKFTIVRLLSLQMQNTKGGDYIGTLAFEMKLLKNDERQCKRRTIDGDGFRLAAIGHLGDSGDL